MLMWIPGNRETPGNEAAGGLVKEGATGVPVGQTAVIPFVAGKQFTDRHLELEHVTSAVVVASPRIFTLFTAVSIGCSDPLWAGRSGDRIPVGGGARFSAPV